MHGGTYQKASTELAGICGQRKVAEQRETEVEDRPESGGPPY